MKKIFEHFRDMARVWQSWHLMMRIFFGIVIGAGLALLFPGISGIAIFGDLFVGSLKAIAPILVAVLVMSSISRARNGLGARFKTIVALYMLTTLMAAVIAVFASRLFPVNIVLNDIAGASNTAPGALGEVFRNIAKEVTSNPITAITKAKSITKKRTLVFIMKTS